MDLFKFARRPPTDKNRHTIITFTGGMGAQIISAAIYFSMRNAGRPVYVDLSYFDKPENIAAAGKPGDCSHWSWALEPFGLPLTLFDTFPDLTKRNAVILHDSPQKLELGLDALAQHEVRKHFEISAGVSDVLPVELADGFLCMHVRRGDYVNVATHLIADVEFISLVKKFSGLVKSAVVISDSPIGLEFREAVSSCFKEIFFMDNTDAYTAHRLMRCARILICSNSQFSLIAAALNPNALVIIPKQWYEGRLRNYEAPLNSRCAFQIMENGGA